EGQLRQLRARIADRPIDGVDVPIVELPGARNATGPVEFLPLGAQPGHPILAEDGHRSMQEVQVQAALGPGGLSHREARERLRHLHDLVARIDGLSGAYVDFEYLGVDDNVAIGDITELTQLEPSELRL